MNLNPGRSGWGQPVRIRHHGKEHGQGGPLGILGMGGAGPARSWEDPTGLAAVVGTPRGREAGGEPRMGT